jgi:Heparinase II/III-like protein/Heparinase II/III N-terminus
LTLEQLRWQVARLRAMTPEEVRWRIEMRRIKARWKRGAPKPAALPTSPEMQRAAKLPFFALPLERESLYVTVDAAEIEAVLTEADAILAGQWPFFAFSGQNTQASNTPTNWQRDDRSGISADIKAFGPDIDYRDPKRVGNIKYTWEKSRHQHTTVLALAWCLTGKDQYGQGALYAIEGWLKHNPAPRGVNWTSALEVGLRLISWAWVFHLLRGHRERPRVFVSQAFLESLYQHQCFLVDFGSQGSSANHHLIAEAAGRYIAALTWPVFAESPDWQQQARIILEREIQLQIFESGINREMSFGYHVFTTEALLLPAILGEQRGDDFSKEYLERLGAQVKVLAWLRNVNGNTPRYGDGDEGMAVQLQARTEPRTDWIINLGRRFLDVPVAEARHGSLTSTLLLGPKTPGEPQPKAQRVPESFGFQDAGVYAMAFMRGTPSEVLVVADAGPLGYLPTVGHGHADALSFTLSVGGRAVIVDPGTFAYHTQPDWRTYFKSTRAHNTIELDNHDQSEQQGAFLWGAQANVALERWEPRSDGGTLTASHDGYTRLPGKPTHRRELELRGKKLTITDQIAGSGAHQVSAYLHLHPDCEPTDEGHGRWRVRFPGGEVRVRFDSKLIVTAHRGETDGLRIGWYSPRFDVNVPSWTLFASRSSALPLEIKTVIEVL